MREIKFRAWDMESKIMFDWDGMQEWWEDVGYSDNMLRGDHYVPMQYTGIKDMYGKEIYEGDIIYSEVEEANFLVLWDDETARYVFEGVGLVIDFDNCYGQELQVVGNKYENPELLEGEII